MSISVYHVTYRVLTCRLATADGLANTSCFARQLAETDVSCATESEFLSTNPGRGGAVHCCPKKTLSCVRLCDQRTRHVMTTAERSVAHMKKPERPLVPAQAVILWVLGYVGITVLGRVPVVG